MKQSTMTIDYIIQQYNNLVSNAEDLEKALKQMGHSIDKNSSQYERGNVKLDKRLAVQLLFKEWERINDQRLEFLNTVVKILPDGGLAN